MNELTANRKLKIGKDIAKINLDILGDIETIREINSGFNNTIFNVNDKFIIKVCLNKKLENTFKTEYEFYLSNRNNNYIPKLYKYDDSKNEVKYVYEIIEKLEGKTLYYYWYKMNESERENIIKELIDMIKSLHLVKVDEYNWSIKIKNDVKSKISECKHIFKKEELQLIMNSLEKYDEYLIDNKFTLIHNDLHFDNIMYNKGKLKIIDFNDSIKAPIDFEFRQLYICQQQPWKWANIEIDPYQKPCDYKNIWNYIKKHYKELGSIKYLEQRMIIYSIWSETRHIKKYPQKELIENMLLQSKKLLQ